jgi:hypothetical protein
MTVPTSSSHRREIPHGYLLEDEEIKSEGELDATIAPFVHEQEQNLG